MPSLEIDIGNSRTKYRLGEQRGVVPAPTLPLDLDGMPDRIRVSAVKGDRHAIRASLRDIYGVEPEFARVETPCGGVRCAYVDPGRLGVDRWLAVLAAWQIARAPALVCDVGTAMTLDYVDGAGVHRGGFIAPGIATMRRALRSETRDVRPDDRMLDALAWGRDTDTAVAGGTLAMALGAIAAAERLASVGGETPRLMIAGGDAEPIMAVMDRPAEHRPDLVLDGLLVALP